MKEHLTDQNKLRKKQYEQTIEEGEICLSVVPAGWEIDGMLHWPKKSAVSKLSKDEGSVPTSKWERINCIKKREFATRAEAEQEMEKMEAVSDTEADELYVASPPMIKKTRRENHKKRVRNSVNDFNELVQLPNENQSKHQHLAATVAGNGGFVIQNIVSIQCFCWVFCFMIVILFIFRRINYHYPIFQVPIRYWFFRM